MRLYRLKIRPLSPWRTPWQSDTLFGLLCWTCARTEGDDVLQRDIIDPALAGQPPFILSDAFPGDFLPTPLWVRAHNWPVEDRRTVTLGRWVTRDDFQRLRAGQLVPIESLLPDIVTEQHRRTHTTFGRLTPVPLVDASAVADTTLSPVASAGDVSGGHLTLYFRVTDDFADRLLALLESLADSGFGADTSTGRGQFDLPDDPQYADDLDVPPLGANGMVALSTFQPANTDPLLGVWETFTKQGRLGPGLGLDEAALAKNPLLLLRPGACFRSEAFRPFLGRAITPGELLSPAAAAALNGWKIIHAAFALTVPAHFPS